jgi:hypothetical protein
MSKIEVDAITQQSGSTLTVGGGASKTVVADATTVTLGRCGGTVALASGASQSGFGRTGTVDWQTGSIKTATFTAANGEGYFANTSGGAFTMNLPAGTAGNIVSVVDYTNTFQTNNLTVAANGSQKIGGVQATVALNTEGQSVTFVYVDDTEGWKNVQDSTSNVTGSVPFMAATVSGTGNTLTTAPCCSDVKIATFTGPGTFCVSQIALGPTAPANNGIAYMVVAGGGGGGKHQAGGGGAGGFRESNSPVTPYTASPLNGPGCTTLFISSTGGIPVVVGSGGAAGTSTCNGFGSNGGVSTFSTVTSAGGGGGGGYKNVPAGGLGQAGGSGGGGASSSQPGGGLTNGGAGNTPPVSPAQGKDGGGGFTPSPHSGGGGGGAGAVGQSITAPGCNGGAGGTGVSTSISGASVARAGGGGGSACGGPAGGVGGSGGGGGGGKGTSPTAAAGTVNTGGGGGGAAASPTNGGGGGSGIVIIRYKFQ